MPKSGGVPGQPGTDAGAGPGDDGDPAAERPTGVGHDVSWRRRSTVALNSASGTELVGVDDEVDRAEHQAVGAAFAPRVSSTPLLTANGT